MTVKKIIVAFLFAFCFQNLDVYGCKDCCDKCCEDCCKEASKKEDKENEDENKEYYLVGDLEETQRESLVCREWYNYQKDTKPVLKIFTKVQNKTNAEGGNIKITIKDGKIKEDDENVKQLLKLADGKYALFKIIKKDEEKPIYLYCSDIESVVEKIYVYGIFYKCTHTEISVIASDTQEVTNMSAMFSDCNNLLKLDLNNFDTRAVENMKSMFAACNNLLKLDLSNFDTGAVDSMWGMFANCNQLEGLNLTKFNTEKVTNMNGMFYQCKSLTNLDLSSFKNTISPSMADMFNGCENLKNINITDAFQGSGIQSMERMFDGCTKLEEIVKGGGIEISSPGNVIKYFIEKHKDTE